MSSRKRRPRRVLVLALLAPGAWLGYLNLGNGPLRRPSLRPSAGVVRVDERLELARRYAPVIYHEFHPRGGRQDVPSPVDFDGDFAGDNNWENFVEYELLPTVYYACLETETYLFLTYHLFHPRDWTRLDLGLHLTHENDGENLQVVVHKGSGRVVLLFTQAHYRGGVYVAPGAGFGDGESQVRAELTLVDDAGQVSPQGTHAAVFVEWGGHGIYGVGDPHAHVELRAEGDARFSRTGWILWPAEQGTDVAEPALESGLRIPYRLESTTAKLWPLLARGELSGPGALLDGGLAFEGEHVRLDVPRYYEADRFSGPLGPDRGISPFAVDFHFGAGEVGALFFEPARRYAERLQVPPDWSLVYLDYPYRLP